MVLKKHKLEMAIDEDFCLLGLVSDEPDYKLCWLINKTMGTDLHKMDELELYHRKLKKDVAFAIFAFEDEDSLLTYRIIKNRTEESYFLDELKNLDYIIHIQGEIHADKISSFIQGVGTIPQVRMCVPVDLTKIRNQERLLLW